MEVIFARETMLAKFRIIQNYAKHGRNMTGRSYRRL